MLMATGARSPSTDRSGFRQCRPIGFHIAMGAGFGSLTMVGPGFLPSLGAGHRTTMAAGFIPTLRGYGGLDQWAAMAVVTEADTIVPYGRPLTCLSLDSVVVLASASDRLAGCRLAHVIRSIRGTADTVRDLTSSM